MTGAPTAHTGVPLRRAHEPWTLVAEVEGGGELWQGGHSCDACSPCPPPSSGWSLVVDLWRDEADPLPPEPTRYLHVPIPDAELYSEEAWSVEDAARMVAASVVRGGAVLVRCHWGLNRSGLVVGMALVLLGMPGPRAVELVRDRRGPSALCNLSFAQRISG
jgi:hypothetical protein